MDNDRRLKIISAAWGRQRGYCFFPWIAGDASNKEERIMSFQEGPAFRWPRDRAAILEHMADREGDDLYWCPSLFEYPRRRLEVAMDECALWADLDEIDPREIKDYPPSIAWETSPGRYQALWLVAPGQDIQGASWQGGENHRLTYHLGADPSGWDTTQLLRLPEWPNYKPDRRGEDGSPALGKLLWERGRRYLPDEFEDLPEIQDLVQMSDVVEDQIDAINRREVWTRVRLKVSSEVRQLIAAKEVSGDRSDKLWQMERDLADAGCTVAEIVAIIRPTVWNKYVGRNDELKRLVVEASKAVAQRTPESAARLELERQDFPEPVALSRAIQGIRPPRWIVRQIWTEGGVGFIAGQPKSFKSWFGLDLALSVSTGAPFLAYDEFRVEDPGPVLYVQEEDSLPTLKSRFDKLWEGKKSDKMVIEDGEVMWLPNTEMAEPEIDVVVRAGVTLSDPQWQSWLDEALAKGSTFSKPYKMVMLDPLMMLTGEVDENRGGEVTAKIFRPLSDLSTKYGVAICVIHHMRKRNDNTGNGGFVRGGQNMLGSTAYHAWAHDALYLTLTRGGVEVQRENKDSPLAKFKVTSLANRSWTPRVGRLEDIFADDPNTSRGRATNGNGSKPAASRELDMTEAEEPTSRRGRPSRVVACMKAMPQGFHSVPDIKAAVQATSGATISYSGVVNQLKRLEAEGKAVRKANREGTLWAISN